MIKTLKADHTSRPQSGGWCVSNANIWRQGVFFRCKHPHFLMQKNFRFFEIY